MANSKIITYDLRAPGRKYDDLYVAIKSYENYAKITESTWIIKTEQTCVQVRDKLKTAIDLNDALFVAVMSGEAAWFGLSNDQSKHLKEIL